MMQSGNSGDVARSGGDHDDSVGPFLIGAIVGGVTAALIAIVIGEQRSGSLSHLISNADRRFGRKNKQPRFELLLQ